MVDDYTEYYLAQAQGGGVGGIYKNVRNQKGAGLGSWLAGVYRQLFPYLKSGVKALGGQALTTGVDLLRDAIQGKPLKDSVQTRITEAGTNLTNKAASKMASLVGRGYKKRKRKARSQSRSGVKKRKTSTRKLRKTKIKKKKKGKKVIKISDIFS